MDAPLPPVPPLPPSCHSCLQMGFQPVRLQAQTCGFPLQIPVTHNTTARPVLLVPRKGAASQTTPEEVNERRGRGQQPPSINMQKWQGQNAKGTPGSNFSGLFIAISLLFRKGQILPHGIMTLKQMQAAKPSCNPKPHLKHGQSQGFCRMTVLLFIYEVFRQLSYSPLMVWFGRAFRFIVFSISCTVMTALTSEALWLAYWRLTSR